MIFRDHYVCNKVVMMPPEVCVQSQSMPDIFHSYHKEFCWFVFILYLLGCNQGIFIFMEINESIGISPYNTSSHRLPASFLARMIQQKPVNLIQKCQALTYSISVSELSWVYLFSGIIQISHHFSIHP